MHCYIQDVIGPLHMWLAMHKRYTPFIHESDVTKKINQVAMNTVHVDRKPDLMVMLMVLSLLLVKDKLYLEAIKLCAIVIRYLNWRMFNYDSLQRAQLRNCLWLKALNLNFIYSGQLLCPRSKKRGHIALHMLVCL